MLSAPIPSNDKERLNELYKYELLDTVYEDDFDDIVRLASKICNVPMSLITLIDVDRQWFKARIGFEGSETARDISFCGHAILNDNLFEIPDTENDERFADNPFVLGDPFVRYYAGMPLVTGTGHKLGTLCVIDSVPRKLDEEQTYALKVLSRQVVKLFELRLKNKELKKISDVQQHIITILAHDMRNPLAALKMTVELKEHGMLSDEAQKEIDHLTVVQLNSTLDLLDNVVNWGQLQLNSSLPEVDTFDMHDLATDILNQILLSARAKNNELVNMVPTGMRVTGNKQAIQFILRNLTVNANKFTYAGVITISANVVANKLIISVKDTGVGMSPKVKETLFQRRSTTTQLGTHSEKGSGVGLKLVYEYLQSINGDIDFISKPGAGTEVVITLPLVNT